MNTARINFIKRLAVSMFALLLIFVTPAPSCSLVRGYFHQVTRLKGKVLGRSLGPVQFRWLRQMFSVAEAELTLYDYNQPFSWHSKPAAIARIQTNSAGEFEFGNIPEGHYRLEISGKNLYDLFDVEITKKVPPTKSVTIDVSPIFPDCTGGHEFEVE